MIDISEANLKIVLDILKKHVPDCEVRAFGSRYKWTAKDYSDLDLAIVGNDKLDWEIISDLKEDFQESDLTFRVDVIDWNSIEEDFRKVILDSGYEIILATNRISYKNRNEKLKIASILSLIDEKIELNKKMNQTLEQIAQAILKM